MIGIVTVFSCNAYALIDTGATHSFVSKNFVNQMNVQLEPLECGMVVTTPTRDTLLAENVYRDREIVIEGKAFPVSLVLLDIQNFDIILGMDWLATHHATLDCFQKEVRFNFLGSQI